MEKMAVAEFFANQPHGRFLIIGAYTGDSSVLTDPMGGLLEKGWSGVFCEPNPEVCTALISNVGTDKHTIVNCAVTIDGGIKQFYVTNFKNRPAPISSINKEWHSYLTPDVQEEITTIKPIVINTITFDQLLEVVGTDFDFVSIDVENVRHENDDFVMSLDFSKLPKCRLLCIELISVKTVHHLAKFGYRLYRSKSFPHAYYNFFFVRDIPQ